MHYPLIDIYVDEAPNSYWHVQAYSNVSVDSFNDPEQYGDTEEHRSKLLAVRSAKALADSVCRHGTADRATVFVEGNEEYHVRATDKKFARRR